MQSRPAVLACFVAWCAASCVDSCSAPGLRDTEARVRVPPTLELGRVWLGDGATATLAIESIGTGWLRVLSVESADATVATDFTPPADGARVGPGTTLAVKLTWTPVQEGVLDTTVTVTTDVEGAREHVVQVRGEAKQPPDCDDGNACTDDRFDRATGRCSNPRHERACDDGSACTEDDRCAEGVCRGRAKTCNDDDVCTLDLCDPAKGCVFPPNDLHCDDGDPCTRDVCDREDGCTHPDAPDGTACGALSCATANLCVFGTCRALDVRGSSDGWPCFDGDLCTEGDACLDGECVGGPRVQTEPTLVATLETFGGHGSRVASDGFRFLFADADALRLATRTETGLEHVATVPHRADFGPVVLSPGLFVVAAFGALTLVDATDPAAPAIAWTHAIEDVEGLNANLRVSHLVASAGGVLVATDIIDEDVREPGPVYFLPIAGTPPVLGAAQWLFAGTRVLDLDADAATYAALTGAVLTWTPFGRGSPVVVPSNAARVSIRGTRAALLFHDRLELLEASPGRTGRVTCEESAGECAVVSACAETGAPGLRTCAAEADCPTGATCVSAPIEECTGCREACDPSCCLAEPLSFCTWDGRPGATRIATFAAPLPSDVLLDEGFLYWATDEGVFAASLALRVPDVTLSQKVDELGATRLERGPSLVLTSGPLALPLERTLPPDSDPHPGSVPEHRRLTGTGHGEVTAIADAPIPRLRVAGPVATGEIDLLEKKFSSWNLTATAASALRPRVLQGTSSWSMVGDAVTDDGENATTPCPGVVIGVVDGSARETALAPCGLHGGHVDVAGGRLWAATDEWPDIRAMPPRPMLRAWSLAPFTPLPRLELPLGDPSSSFSWRVRASDAGDRVAIASWEAGGTDASRVKVRVHDALASTATPRASATIHGRVQLQRDAVATDGDAVLVGGAVDVSLYELAPGDAAPLATAKVTTALADAAPPDHTRIVWMAKQRAWASFRRRPAPLEPRMSLAELRYDLAASSIEGRGVVDLPSAAGSVRDTGIYTVVTTRSGVSIVAPSCR